MKILFIENREKTFFWEKIAHYLHAQGHNVHWLIQNHMYRPRQTDTKNISFIPYPTSKEMAIETEELLIQNNYPLMTADRGRVYFQSGTGHYNYYRKKIENILNSYQPDLVVGESTLFHELIAIGLCRKLGAKYVQPMSNRYPRGRFSLLSFDSQNPIIESGEQWTYEQALHLAERIAKSAEMPFYMQNLTGTAKLRQQLNLMAAHGRVWSGRLWGERYNTPSATRKLALNKALKRNAARWHALERIPREPKNTVLYPMQLQPEANIDVWGQPFSNQTDLIKRLLYASPDTTEIAVKINPKTKYELTDELLSLADKEKRICLLPKNLPMNEALKLTTGAVTVTGTVAFEAICGKGRVVSLRHPIIEREFPEFHAETPEIAVHRLIKDPQTGVGNIERGATLIQRLVNQSFSGLIGDPISYPACMLKDNISSVAKAIMRINIKN